ncbi:hypothetical protein EIP91_010630 [Steccherinum ochraceum]|uniref:Protein kinase domain-containing protein n=1 Tax=Steccherinum ochraceum TaxID=92696 RepID=A0A4R0R897_9APHY|nr:hypothetical protein EIP91_010630 [Steccherinum ochraceum]
MAWMHRRPSLSLSKSPDTTLAKSNTELSPMREGKALRPSSHRVDGTNLLASEIFWRDHYLQLMEKGYVLRRRYEPTWEASWKSKDNNDSYWLYEDGQMIPEHGMLDATCTKDCQVVTLRRIPRGSATELQTHRHLLESAPDGVDLKAKDNIVPILDEFQFSDEDLDTIIVMPYLRPSSDPSCETVQDVVKFLESAFKGLQYMHQCGVAHGRCNLPKCASIMMDPRPIFRELPHFVNMQKSRDFKRDVKGSRAEAGDRVTYYWVNFAHAVSERAAMKQPQRDDETAPQDAFAKDAFDLGSMVWSNFIEDTQHLKFLIPLVQSMKDLDASKRPDMDEVVKQFSELLHSLSPDDMKKKVSASSSGISDFLSGLLRKN